MAAAPSAVWLRPRGLEMRPGSSRVSSGSGLEMRPGSSRVSSGSVADVVVLVTGGIPYGLCADVPHAIRLEHHTHCTHDQQN